jgi:hypothetical protein
MVGHQPLTTTTTDGLVCSTSHLFFMAFGKGFFLLTWDFSLPTIFRDKLYICTVALQYIFICPLTLPTNHTMSRENTQKTPKR